MLPQVPAVAVRLPAVPRAPAAWPEKQAVRAITQLPPDQVAAVVVVLIQLAATVRRAKCL